MESKWEGGRQSGYADQLGMFAVVQLQDDRSKRKGRAECWRSAWGRGGTEKRIGFKR